MTNHEQRIILAWLEAERLRLRDTADEFVERTGDPYVADYLGAQYNYVSRQIERVAALDTSAPALTDDERKAQAAGVLGKMGNGVA